VLQLASRGAKSAPSSAPSSPRGRPDQPAPAQQQAQPSSNSSSSAPGASSGYLGYFFGGGGGSEEQAPPGPEVCKLAGSWLAYLNIGGARYWTLAECRPDVWVPPPDALPSDCRWAQGHWAEGCRAGWEARRAAIASPAQPVASAAPCLPPRSACQPGQLMDAAPAPLLAPRPPCPNCPPSPRHLCTPRYREDLVHLAKGDVKASQQWKEALEVRQRADKKLRPQHAGGH
jgi:hypothetical protein